MLLSKHTQDLKAKLNAKVFTRSIKGINLQQKNKRIEREVMNQKIQEAKEIFTKRTMLLQSGPKICHNALCLFGNVVFIEELCTEVVALIQERGIIGIHTLG
jgi:hypothetical protein